MAIYNNDRDPNITSEEKKWQVRVFWGEDLVREIENNTDDELINWVPDEKSETPGDSEWYTFGTEAERNAFLLGISESDGWYGMRCVMPEDINEQIN